MDEKEPLEDDVITTAYETEIINSQKSKKRSTAYAFFAALLALFAFYVDMEAEEIALWQLAIGAAIPFGGLVTATLRTWPKRLR
jgi:hypothetical protein